MPSKSSNDGQRKSFWVRADAAGSWEERKPVVMAAAEAAADLVVVREEDIQPARKMGIKALGVVGGGPEVPEDVVRVNPDPTRGDQAPGDAALIDIKSGADQETAMRLAESYPTIVVDCRDWRVIPLENLVAACQRIGAKLLAVVKGPEDAAIALGVLQKGADGILLDPRGPGDVQETAPLVGGERRALPLVEAEIRSLTPVGMGDRACVDTCSMLERGEGMLIGSQADGLVLVHGETIESEYVESRPFRVNAGAVHSYVLHIDDKTRYLSDLRAGDPALVVGASGTTRVVAIGRVKIETRPLLMVELDYDGNHFKVILQDAETIRLVTPGGEAAH
jgi:3-dehydroquinate synthase II